MKFIIRLLLLAVLILILLFTFAPNIISTQWGKTVFFKIYKAATGNTLTAESFEISWWNGQKLTELSLEKPREQAAFTGESITTDATLWQILFSHNLGNMEIKTARLTMCSELPAAIKNKIPISRAGFIPAIHASLPSVPHYFGHITVTDGEAQFLTPGYDPIDLKSVALDISLLKSQIKLQGSGKSSQGNIGGNFTLSLFYDPDQSQIDLTANLQNFPIRSLDQTIALFYPSLQGVFLEAIGPALNIQLKIRNLPQTLELFCDASSPSFSAHIETQTQDGHVTLASPALIQFQVPSKFLSKPFKGQLKIDSFSLPLDQRENFAFQATLTGEALQLPFGVFQPFALFVSTDDFQKRNFTLKINSSQVQLNSILYFPDEWQQLTLTGEGLLPSNTHINFSAQTLSNLTATVQGDEWQGDFWGGYDAAQKTVFLTKPAQINYRLKQLPLPLPSLLQEPLPIHIQIEPFRLSLLNPTTSITAHLKTDPITLQGIPLGATTLSVTGNPQTRQGTFELDSTLNQGPVHATGSFSGAETFAAKVTFSDISISIADPFLAHSLTPIIGSLGTGTLDMTYFLEKKNIQFDLKTDALAAKGALEQTPQSLRLTQPVSIDLTLTPAGYKALDQWLNPTPTPFVLLQSTPVKARITSFQWPDVSCKADISIDTLSFAQSSQKSTQLNHIALQLDYASQTPLVFNLSAQSLSAKGKVDPKTGFAEVSCRLDQFPTSALDVISRAAGQSSVSWTSLFGPELNLSATASLQQWNGPVQLQLNSSQIRASLKGTLTQGVMTLADNLYMQVTLTPDLSHWILNQLNPFSLSSITTDAPITLEIPAAGFSYPLFPLNHAQINIPSGRLELGKVHCQNEGNVNITLGLLKQSQASSTIELWFAPLDFHIKNGILDCERTEILIANNLQICTWGIVDFVAQDVDMILGLTASCLRKAFGIKNLPDNYVLQLPMRGPLNNVKINTSKATAKIGALLLWQQKAVSSAFGKSPGGAVVGELLKKLGPLPDGNSKAPPPKRPFPWENQESSSSKKKKVSDASNKNKKLINPEDKPLKQALKFLR